MANSLARQLGSIQQQAAVEGDHGRRVAADIPRSGLVILNPDTPSKGRI